MLCHEYEHDRDQIIEIIPRRNELVRKTEYKNITIAANIDTIIIVCATEPIPSLELLDHYIVAAELMPAEVIIAVNKSDLKDSATLFSTIEKKYSKLPYHILRTSNHSSPESHDLTRDLQNKTCIFVGQSGVGKSTLINSLVPDLAIETQAISDQINQGRHTTSTTTLYDLPNGGELIDSPGVRDFTMPELNAKNIIKGFIEIDRIGKTCKFHNCIHMHEPKCAVKQALEDKEIHPDRYHAYINLIESTPQNMRND